MIMVVGLVLSFCVFVGWSAKKYIGCRKVWVTLVQMTERERKKWNKTQIKKIFFLIFSGNFFQNISEGFSKYFWRSLLENISEKVFQNISEKLFQNISEKLFFWSFFISWNFFSETEIFWKVFWILLPKFS